MSPMDAPSARVKNTVYMVHGTLCALCGTWYDRM